MQPRSLWASAFLSLGTSSSRPTPAPDRPSTGVVSLRVRMARPQSRPHARQRLPGGPGLGRSMETGTAPGIWGRVFQPVDSSVHPQVPPAPSTPSSSTFPGAPRGRLTLASRLCRHPSTAHGLASALTLWCQDTFQAQARLSLRALETPGRVNPSTASILAGPHRPPRAVLAPHPAHTWPPQLYSSRLLPSLLPCSLHPCTHTQAVSPPSELARGPGVRDTAPHRSTQPPGDHTAFHGVTQPPTGSHSFPRGHTAFHGVTQTPTGTHSLPRGCTDPHGHSLGLSTPGDVSSQKQLTLNNQKHRFSRGPKEMAKARTWGHLGTHPNGLPYSQRLRNLGLGSPAERSLAAIPPSQGHPKP